MSNIAVSPEMRLLFARLIGGEFRAQTHATMLPPRDPRGKYITSHTPITDAQIAAHIRGDATYAIKVIDILGLAHAWVVELDAGGLANVRRYINALTAAGLPCIGIAVQGAGSHNGGHIWGLYAVGVDPIAARAQISAALQRAGLKLPEVWPTGQHIRAPFGIHTYSGQRGWLVRPDLPDANLDTSEGLQIGLQALASLPPSPAPPPLPPPAPRATRSATRSATHNQSGESAAEVIAAFNAAHPIADLLTTYGAQPTRHGWACNCGVPHQNSTQFVITSQGKAVFFSDRCRWAPARTDLNGRPVADSFDLFTKVEHHGEKRAALRALGWSPRHRAMCSPVPPPTDDDRRSTAPEVLTARKEASEQRAARRRAANERIRQAVLNRAAEELVGKPEIYAKVLHRMLEMSGTGIRCHPRAIASKSALQSRLSPVCIALHE